MARKGAILPVWTDSSKSNLAHRAFRTLASKKIPCEFATGLLSCCYIDHAKE